MRCPSSSLFSYCMGDALAPQLHTIFFLVSFPLLWTAVLNKRRCFIQPNSLTSPNTVCIMVSRGPTFLPSPDVSLLPDFSGIVEPVTTVHVGECPLLCISHCIFISPMTSRIQFSPRQDWFPCFRRGGSCKIRIADPALLQNYYSSRDQDHSHHAMVSGTRLGNFPVHLQNFLTIHFFFNVLCNL